MARSINLILSVALCATISAAAAMAQPANPAAVAGPNDVIATRQIMFHLSAATFGEMKEVADAGGDVTHLFIGTRGLVRWARSIPAMFPPGSTGPLSRARPEIWSNRADFEARAAAYQVAAEQLAAAAQHGDRAAFLQQWVATSHVCAGCHEAYRAHGS
jgi:cytochrome c556